MHCVEKDIKPESLKLCIAGIEMNVPAHEIEVEKSNQEHVGRVIPDIDVDAIGGFF